MRYLVIITNEIPFYTNWFDCENNFNSDVGMIVFDLFNHVYTVDGKKWDEIIEDHL